MAYQARLESASSRKVTVGSNPTLSAIFYLLIPMLLLYKLLLTATLLDNI